MPNFEDANRLVPLSGTEGDRNSASGQILGDEIHSTSDQQRLFLENKNLVTVFHGSVATASARLSLNANSNRGVWIGDLCIQADTGEFYICKVDKGLYSSSWELAGTINGKSSTLMKTTVTLTNAAGGSIGTLDNAPSAGNPTKWIEINDNGTIRRIPTW